MEFSSNLKTLAIRFTPYIEELRAFFTTQNIDFGRPVDLTEFADRVEASTTLRDDVGSLLRSILYREAEKIRTVELFELLVLAVAGEEIEEETQKFQQTNGRIFKIVDEALRNSRPRVSDRRNATPSPEHTATVAGRDRLHADETRQQHGVVPDETADVGTGLHGRHSIPFFTSAQEHGSPPRLFASHGTSDSVSPSRTPRDEVSRRNRAIILYAIAAVILAGAAFYFGRSRGLSVGEKTVATQPSTTEAASPVGGSGADCMGRSNAQWPALEQSYRHVQDLRLHKQYGAALDGLLDIASSDPGYPGVYLDISDLDLQLRRTQQARDAVSAQMALSDCLAALPAPALDAYCKAELPTETLGNCRSHLARIKASAQLQAALTTQEPARGPDAITHGSPSTSARPVARIPLPAQAQSVRPSAAAPRKPVQDQSLIEGKGTDLSLGAYSKPQN